MSRDDTIRELRTRVRRLAVDLTREKAAHRRTAEELAWAQETVRVYRRIIEKLGSADGPREPGT